MRARTAFRIRKALPERNECVQSSHEADSAAREGADVSLPAPGDPRLPLEAAVQFCTVE